MEEKTNIEVSQETLQAINELKAIFGQIFGQEINDDDEVIKILISGFLQTIQGGEGGHQHNGECCGGGECSNKNNNSPIIT